MMRNVMARRVAAVVIGAAGCISGLAAASASAEVVTSVQVHVEPELSAPVRGVIEMPTCANVSWLEPSVQADGHVWTHVHDPATGVYGWAINDAPFCH